MAYPIKFYNKVDLCGINTAKLKTLTAQEMRILLVAAHNGDENARTTLIDGNLRLVLSIVQRFQSRGENPDDLFQVGCIGLIKAVDNFNVEMDVKFSTYAVPMIIGEVRRYLRDNNALRVSRSIRDLAYKALSAREILSRTMAREPTIEEIVAALEKEGFPHTKEEVASALEAIVEPISLYDPVYTDGSSDSLYVMDQISDPSCSDEVWVENLALKEALEHLSCREQMIIRLRFFKGKTQMEIASAIGISQAQVSRLEKGALERIRKEL